MTAIQLGNDLGLAPPKARPSLKPIEPVVPSSSEPQAPASSITSSSLEDVEAQSPFQSGTQTEFSFELPIGYMDAMGQSHRQGIMRLARTVDEISPMSDPRVQANPAYATVIILAQVILSLGTLPEVSPVVIENMFAGDLNYLQNFYRKINRLED